MRNDFAIFVMTYNRPGDIPTVVSLKKNGYTGRMYLIVGDDDPGVERYRRDYGEQVIVFDKAKYVKTTDKVGLNVTKVICFARNACFDIAEQLGLKYFVQMDDDYTCFHWGFGGQMQYITKQMWVKSYDAVMETMLEFFEQTPPSCLAIAHAQGGDFLGGGATDTFWTLGRQRKCMNTWLCATARRFAFRGTMNEDVSAYTTLSHQGFFFLTIMNVRLNQPVTQSTSSGMTAIYKKFGTHAKSYLSVILNPSFIKVGVLTNHHQRLHHVIQWKNGASKIIREKYKKQ